MMELTDKYVITVDHIITNFDKSIVSWLYQPIMGYKAIALYNALLEEQGMYARTKNSLVLKRLLRVTGLTDTGFKNAKEKLEGLGLLKTYLRKKTNTYNFKIKPPISPENFFEDEVLSNLLMARLGEQDYEYSVLRFSKADDVSEDDVDVSSSFKDAYADEIVADQPVVAYKRNFVAKEEVKNNFEIVLDFAQIDHILINKKLNLSIYLPFKTDITKLANFYKITTKEVAKLIIESISKNTVGTLNFDLNRFSELIRSRYDKRILENFRHGEQMAMHIDVDNKASNMTMLEAKIKEMSSIEPAEYLSLLKDNKPLTTVELELLSDLLVKFNLSFGVINCLMEFVHFKNSGHRIEPNYVYKIATTISTMQLTTVESTMDHLRKAFQSNNQKIMIRDVLSTPDTKRPKYSAKQNVINYENPNWKRDLEPVNLSEAEIDEIISSL